MRELVSVTGFVDGGVIEAVFREGGVERTLRIVDDPASPYRQVIAAWQAKGNTIPPYSGHPPAGAPYRLYKSVFIRRMTEGEAETMEAALAAAPAKLRLMFNSVEYFVSDDPLFEELKAAVASALGEARAAELLAPSRPDWGA